MVDSRGKEVPVYVYVVGSQGSADHLAASMALHGYSIETFDLKGGVDYYSLPNLVKTMRTNRYSLADEILAVPLLTLDAAFKNKAA